MKRILRGRRFPGGIVLDKDPAWRAPIETLPVPDWVALPLLDHNGEALDSKVKVGTRVGLGEVLAGDEVPLLSSLAGKVAAIEPHPHLSGFRVPSLRIERQGEEGRWEPSGDWRRMGQEDLLREARRKGLCLPDLGGSEVEALVVRAFHDDPYTAVAQRLILESPDALRQGLAILQRLYVCQRAFIAVESRPPQAFSAWRAWAREMENVVLVNVPNQYPQAEEDLLFSAVLPRRILRELEAETARAIAVSAEEVLLLAEALVGGRPGVEKLLTLAGSGVPSPRTLRVRIGTPLSFLFSCCGLDPQGLGKVVAGGATRGWAQFDDRAGIGRDTSGLLAIRREEVELSPEEPCIRCGWCLEACPHDLNPVRLWEACRQEQWEAAEAYGLWECSECGACAYSCPAHLKLVHWFRFGKQEAAARGRDKNKPLAA